VTVPLGRRLAAEALGTGILVATVVGSGIMAERLAGGNEALALLCNTVATGAVLYVLITVFQPVSAHFNPAVSLMFAVRGDFSWALLVPFVLVQVAGGIAGTWIAHAMFDLPLLQVAAKVRTGGGQWLSEVVATAVLVLTILGSMRRPETVPAAVALVITAAYWFTASTSFANPAVTIARSLTDSFSGIGPADVPAFIGAQVVGAMVGLWVANVLTPRMQS